MGNRVTLRKRVPGILWVQSFICGVLSAWSLFDILGDPSLLVNNVQVAVFLMGLNAVVCALYLSHRVSWDDTGIYIMEGGASRLLGLQREQFIAFGDIRKVDVVFFRGGGGTGGLHELLQFGHLSLKGRRGQRALTIHQMFVNRRQLVELLYRLKSVQPSAIKEKLIDDFVAGI